MSIELTDEEKCEKIKEINESFFKDCQSAGFGFHTMLDAWLNLTVDLCTASINPPRKVISALIEDLQELEESPAFDDLCNTRKKA